MEGGREEGRRVGLLMYSFKLHVSYSKKTFSGRSSMKEKEEPSNEVSDTEGYENFIDG